MQSPSFEDDIQLLAQIVNRDQAALSALYDRYAKIIFSVAFKSLGLVEDCEEVVIDVFAQVWRIAERYDPNKARVDTWIFMITRSRILDRLRKRQRSLAMADDSNLTEIQIPAANVDLVEEAIIRERREQVYIALQTLPKEQQYVLELAYFQGLTQSQIVKQTGLSLGTVKTRIRLGLGKLKAVLQNYP